VVVGLSAKATHVERSNKTMRMFFGLISLLLVLVIVGSIGKKQLQSLGQIGNTSTRTPTDRDAKAVTDAVMGRARDGAATVAVPADMGAMAGAAPAVVEGTVPMQAQAIQNNVRDATNAALQKGVDRSNNSQP
jgi:hypothetical protein